jgi:hypothetical protein
MIRKSRFALALAAALAAAVPAAQAALTHAGDIAFTAFNADEDGLSFVAFADIAANTTVLFRDDEWTGAAFNTGESAASWNSGAADIAAGTVVRLLSYDKTTRSASVGTLTGAINTNFGLANSNEVVYAYLGADANTPTAFLAAITNGSFSVDGSIAGTGLTEGLNAIRLNTNATSATPDYAEYSGIRSGLADFGSYKTLVGDAGHWNVDTTNGAYLTTVPDITAFTISPVPEPGSLALMLAGLGIVGVSARRRAAA